MKLMLALFVSWASVASIQCGVTGDCKNDTDCSVGECCYIQPEFMVVSKRQAVALPLQPIHMHHDTGVCEKYTLEHGHCWPLEKANGHCSCGAGLSCQFVPAATLTVPDPVILQPVNGRSIYMPGPGTFQCEKQTS